MRDGSKADDTPSEAVRTSQPVDVDEVDGNAVASLRQPAKANGNGSVQRRSSGGLMGRYWSTTSVLDMANAYNRSVMPSMLTDAEERMLEDVEEESSDWEDSDCESEPDSAGDSQSDDNGDEELLAATTSALFPTSLSQPEMHADLARKRSASLPKTSSDDGALEHLSARRQSSRLLRGESLRRQLFQETMLSNPALRRNSSVECLPMPDAAGAGSVDLADGCAASAGRSDRVKPRHTVIGYSLPVWSALESRGPSRQTSSSATVAITAGAAEDHSVLQLCTSEPVRSASPRLTDDSAQRCTSDTTSAAAHKSRSLGAVGADHRRSYMLAIDPSELNLAKSGTGTLRKIKKSFGKVFKHRDSVPGASKEASSASGVSNDSGLECSPPVSSTLEHQESVFSSTETADDFVYSTPARELAAKQRSRVSSAPVPSRFKDMLKKKTTPERHSVAESIRSDDTCSSLSDHSSRGSSPSSENAPEFAHRERKATILQRFQSPILTRRWKMMQEGRSGLDRQHSSSVPTHLHHLETGSSPEPPIRPFIRRLMDIEPRHLAEELTLLDAHRQQQIQANELIDCAWMSKDRDVRAPNIMTMVEHFNRLALITTKEVLTPATAEKRARAIGYFIKVGEECLKLQNFNSLKAILAGLQCTPMFRLQRTWKEVSANKMKRFDDLSELMTENKNYVAYRHRMVKALDNPPCVPFLGVFLTQICQMETFHQMHHKRKRSLRGSTRRRLSRRGTKGKNDADSRPAVRRKSTKRTPRPPRAPAAERLSELPTISQTDEIDGNGADDQTSSVAPESQPLPVESTDSRNNAPHTTACAESQDRANDVSCASSCSHECPLDRVNTSRLHEHLNGFAAQLNGHINTSEEDTNITNTCSDAQDSCTDREERHSEANLNENEIARQRAGSTSPASMRFAELTDTRRPHDSLISEDSAYVSDLGSRASSTTLMYRNDSSYEGRDESGALVKRASSVDQPSPLTETHTTLHDASQKIPEDSESGVEGTGSEKPTVAANASTEGSSKDTSEPLKTETVDGPADQPGLETSPDDVENTGDAKSSDSPDGVVKRAHESLKRKVKEQHQLSSSSLRSANSGNVRERLATVVGMVPSPRPKRRTSSETSVSHSGSNTLTKLRVQSPNSSLTSVGESAQKTENSTAVAACGGEDSTAEAAAPATAERPLTIQDSATSLNCQVSPHMSLAEQLRRYKLAASCYHHASKPWVRYLLDNYVCNTEEQNYLLSCEREPRQESRKSWYERLTS